MKHLITPFLLLSFSLGIPAYPSVQNGKIIELNGNSFTIEGIRDDLPECASSKISWVIDLDKKSGAANLAYVKRAMDSDQKVTVIGNHRCKNGSETIKAISVEFIPPL